MSETRSKTLARMNKEFLCYSNEVIPEEPIARFDRKDFEAGLKVDLVNEFSKESFGGGSYLRNPKFAIFHYLKRVANYYAGDFVYYSKDHKFLTKWKEAQDSFIEKGYFGEVWLAYDEELRELEKVSIMNRGEDGGRKENYPESEFRLYIREPDTGTFRSVGTNVGRIEYDPEKMILCSCDGFDNFVGGGDIISDYLSGHEAFLNAFHASLKVITADVQDDIKYRAEMDHLKTDKGTVFVRNNAGVVGASAHNENEYEELVMFPIEGVAQVLRNNRSGFDERAQFYGAYAKALDAQKNRENVGETWKDHKWVNNIQKTLLRRLQVVVEKMKDKGPQVPKDFNVRLNSNDPHTDQEFEKQNKWRFGENYSGNSKFFRSRDNGYYNNQV